MGAAPRVDYTMLRALQSFLRDLGAPLMLSVVKPRLSQPDDGDGDGYKPNRSRFAQQLTLFCERVTPLPQWNDLGEARRAEIVRLLAQLLRDLHARVRGRLNGGACDE